MISDNEKNIHNIIPQQRKGILNIIEKKKQELSEIQYERRKALGQTLEDLVNNDLNDYASYISLYKDEKCENLIYSSFEEYEKLDYEEVIFFNKILYSHYDRISEEVIKKISVLPKFLNRFSYSKENIKTFLNIPIFNLSYNQLRLFSFGLRNLNVLSNTEGNPPNLDLDAKLHDLVQWYEIQNSILISKKNK